MSFFETLFGFAEGDYDDTQRALESRAQFRPITTPLGTADQCAILVCRDRLVSAGAFFEPSLAELRIVARRSGWDDTPTDGSAALQHVVADARTLHDDALHGGVFQVASQFNYLEFPSPQHTPERGISGYEFDRTQGPAAAIACAGGTAYRNYLVCMDGSAAACPRGQRADRQFNALRDLEPILAAAGIVVPWTVRNGYIEATNEEELLVFNTAISTDLSLRDALKSAVRVGVQWDVEITSPTAGLKYGKNAETKKWELVPVDGRPAQMLCVQVYCSAVGVTYSKKASPEAWAPFAQLVLEAAYEATLLVAVIDNARQPASALPRPMDATLTKVGGGVFGNEPAWIRRAINNAIAVVPCPGLAVRVVHFGKLDAVAAE